MYIAFGTALNQTDEDSRTRLICSVHLCVQSTVKHQLCEKPSARLQSQITAQRGTIGNAVNANCGIYTALLAPVLSTM